MKGSIVRVRQDKGFCFVRGFDEQKDRFLHFSDIANCAPGAIREGLVVDYQPVDDHPKGPRAIQARVESTDERAEFENLFTLDDLDPRNDVVNVPGPRGKIR